MKPLVSLIPLPDRSTEDRKPLTKKQRAELALAQGGRCGCGCGGKLDHAGEGTIDEHGNPLGLTGTNALYNRSIYRKPCAAKKTAEEDLPRIAKAKAQAGETGQYARRQRRGGSSIKGGGFGSVTKKMNGSIGLTKTAARARAANDDRSRPMTASLINRLEAAESGCSNPECSCVPYDGGPLSSERMPWQLQVCDDGWPMVHNGGDVICVPDPNHHAGCAWDVARFRLIAAAPDLLDFALALDASWTESFPDGPDGPCEVMPGATLADEHRSLWKQCRAAILRASNPTDGEGR